MPGMTPSAKVRPQGPKCSERQLQIAGTHRATAPSASPPRHHARFIPPNRPGTAGNIERSRCPTAAGFTIPEYRIVSKTISGSVAAFQRPQFKRLKDRLEPGDILVVTKLDRLGRDAIDVSTTIAALSPISVRVYRLALGGSDLTSSSGHFTMTILNAVPQFERDLWRERTRAGLAAAREKGKRVGRLPALKSAAKQEAVEAIAQGQTIASIAGRLKVSRATITCLRDSLPTNHVPRSS
jgi:putative DNA-invertase from lambdoid prophage Rac